MTATRNTKYEGLWLSPGSSLHMATSRNDGPWTLTTVCGDGGAAAFINDAGDIVPFTSVVRAFRKGGYRT